MNERMYLLITS